VNDHMGKGSRVTYSKKQVALLKRWVSHNIENPYLQLHEKDELARLSGLTPLQVQNWVKNARKVSLF
jgi:Homeodomain